MKIRDWVSRLRETGSCDYESDIGSGTRELLLNYCSLDKDRWHPNVRLLDFGCGGGRYLKMFSQSIPKENLVGVEVLEERVNQVREQGFRAEKLDPDRAHLPFPDASFDIVFSSNVIEHIPNPLYKEYLKEVNRVLVPGGRFVLGTPNYPIKRFYDMFTAMKKENRRLFLYYLFDDPTHINRLSIYRLERDLEPYFTDINLFPSYLFFQRRIKLLRHPEVRRRLRILGYKLSGYCVKPPAGSWRPERQPKLASAAAHSGE